MNRFYKLAIMVFALSAIVLSGSVSPANAQTKVKKDMLEKTNFYMAPREYQIIDDSPIVRDFREAPASSGDITLPPGPGAGPVGGSGGGALGGAPGSSIPGSGLQLGGGGPGYRSAPASLGGPGSLPKSGFGRNSNIPAGGIHPHGLLPNGSSNNQLMGKMYTPQPGTGVSAGPARAMGPTSGRSNGNYNGPAVKSYSSGYGMGSGASVGNSGRTEGIVRGSLLRK